MTFRSFGEMTRWHRRRLRYTQEELAVLIGADHHSAVSMYETNKVTPKFDRGIKICLFLGIPVLSAVKFFIPEYEKIVEKRKAREFGLDIESAEMTTTRAIQAIVAKNEDDRFKDLVEREEFSKKLNI